MTVWAGGILAVVYAGAYAVQRLLTAYIQVEVARKLKEPRPLRSRPVWWKRISTASRLPLSMGRPGPGVPVSSAEGAGADAGLVLKVGGQDILAFVWSTEQAYWETRAQLVRQTFLDRTRETAEKWRTVFAAALAVFGAVLVVSQATTENIKGADPSEKIALLVAIAFALHAVGYTGWAAAGLPKMLVDVNAQTAFEEETNHACCALARLKVGIACGALTAVALTWAFAAAIS